MTRMVSALAADKSEALRSIGRWHSIPDDIGALAERTVLGRLNVPCAKVEDGGVVVECGELLALVVRREGVLADLDREVVEQPFLVAHVARHLHVAVRDAHLQRVSEQNKSSQESKDTQQRQ